MLDSEVQGTRPLPAEATSMARGKQIVLTAPFTEMTDHAGYFIPDGHGLDPDLDGMGNGQKVPRMAKC